MLEKKPIILIVEDDITSQQYYSVVLEDKYEIEIVPTAKHARAVLRKKTYSLIIVDISLPGAEDGISLMRYIRDKMENPPPMLAITAHAFPQNRIDALEAGAIEFFSKPILSGTLLDVLNKHILT